MGLKLVGKWVFLLTLCFLAWIGFGVALYERPETIGGIGVVVVVAITLVERNKRRRLA